MSTPRQTPIPTSADPYASVAQADGDDRQPMALPAVGLTYRVAPFGNRFRVHACRGTVEAAVTTSMETEAEAQETADRLTKRHQELNQR